MYSSVYLVERDKAGMFNKEGGVYHNSLGEKNMLQQTTWLLKQSNLK